MIIQSNYILTVVINGVEFMCEYDVDDVFHALQHFWYDDYPDIRPANCPEIFDIDIRATEKGGVIHTYHYRFNSAVFQAFYDRGRKAGNVYTLDEFEMDIQRPKKKAVVIFGDTPSRRYDEGDIKAMLEALKNGDGQLTQREFDTEAEKRAYYKGIDDCDGWWHYSVVSDADIDKVQIDNI